VENDAQSEQEEEEGIGRCEQRTTVEQRATAGTAAEALQR
jgi:hypothetical protein